MSKGNIPAVVFDTTTVVSALVFRNGQLAWLREHWRQRQCVALITRDTTAELTRVLQYPKFRLSIDDRRELLAEYLPYCRVVENVTLSVHRCRDVTDQPFLNLADTATCTALVSGDHDLLVLADETPFLIETPAQYRARVAK